MKALPIVAGAVCAALLFSVPASAEGGPRARMAVAYLFKNADLNGNGVLDPAEIAEMRMRAFERADADGDGTISRAEQDRAAGRRARRAEMAWLAGEERLDRLDADGDGAISRAEFASAPRPGFAIVDTNADGALDRAEIERFLAILAEAR